MVLVHVHGPWSVDLDVGSWEISKSLKSRNQVFWAFAAFAFCIVLAVLGFQFSININIIRLTN